MRTSNRKDAQERHVPSPESDSLESKSYVFLANLTAEILLQGKWQVHVLCALRGGPVRIGQLGRRIPGASKKVLAQNLRRLEAQGIVVRRDLSDLVLHVEYELRDEVRDSVGDLMDHLVRWGADFSTFQRSVQPIESRT